MRCKWVLPTGALLLAAMLAVPALAADNPPAGQLGSLNYLEGQASIGEQVLNSQSVGSAVLQAGETLNTQNGRAEVLLTPGVFLRLDQNSSVEMISPDLANTQVRLDHGRAMVEGDDIRKENNIRVDMDGASVQLMKNGLYSFDADHNQIFVFKGKARVFVNDKKYDLGNHRELTLAGKPKATGFDAKKYEDDFYKWSSLRSAYLAEANVDAAHSYIATSAGWYGTGWYWDPWFGAYTFLPGAGSCYSPFGWGFYSPTFIYDNPFFYRGPYFHHFGPGYIYPYTYRPFLPGPRPGFGMIGGGIHRGFHNGFGAGGLRGALGIHGGGFHGGGFHGGGFHGGGGHGR